MIRAGRMMGRALRRFAADGHGTATIEFVMFFPMFIVIMISSLELGVIMTRQVMLDRAMDLAVRDLRLGRFPNASHSVLKDAICANAGVIPNCSTELLLEMRPIQAPAYTLPDPAAQCIDRSSDSEPVITFRDGGENELMLLRACALVDPLFPGTGLGLKMQENTMDGFALVATSAYVNEPGGSRSGE